MNSASVVIKTGLYWLSCEPHIRIAKMTCRHGHAQELWPCGGTAVSGDRMHAKWHSVG